MFCKRCGKYYKDLLDNCPYCGEQNEKNHGFYSNSPNYSSHNNHSYSKDRKGLGFALGFFFGILGLLGLLSCNDSEEKSSFMSGWITSFVIEIILIIVIVCAFSCATCAYLY